MPKMKDPEPLEQLPPLESIPSAGQPGGTPIQQQATPAAPLAPPIVNPVINQPPPAPLAPVTETPPVPVVVQSNTAEDTPIVKRRKSKRKELQQASGGTDALLIKLASGKLGATPSGGTGSSGLNIPK